MLMDTYSDCEPAEAAEALRLTEASISMFPHRTMYVRNRARALEEAGKSEEALEWYQRAVWCPDVDDTTAVWFGSELHNRRRHADAIDGFAHLADEIAWALTKAGPSS
jgi:tetratricopeptide (TPR) repeat protein